MDNDLGYIIYWESYQKNFPKQINLNEEESEMKTQEVKALLNKVE